MERYHRDPLSFSEQVRANYQEQRSRGLNANRDTPCAECTLLLLRFAAVCRVVDVPAGGDGDQRDVG